MSELIAPHGGVLVNRFVDDADALRAEAAGLTKVPVSSGEVATVHRIGDGTLSPLVGPMNEDVYNGVLDNQTIEANGKTLAWTIPLALPVTAELAGSLKAGQKVALTDPKGDVIATLDIESVFAWDKPRYIKSVYRTERTDHPGADIVLANPDNADKTHLIGGTLNVIEQDEHPEFGSHIKTPAQIRKMLGESGFDAAVAFQTRNPLHRAHEYALLYGLEVLLQQGKNAVAVLNPLLGETKGDDVNAKVRMQTYETLIESGEFGEGDKNAELWEKVGGEIKDRVWLLGLDIKMFYGGPSEAVMHAIYRQNMGFTNIIIGRKHADAPYADGTAIWGDFDAHEIFDNLGGELEIKPVKVGFAAYYESLGRVDLMENHSDEKPVFISGKQVRATLQAGEQVDPRIMRPSTSAILAAAMKQ
ncbi:MAG: sulfate adenylyltransferase [Phycisphaera sp.]|nr:sulfate adenylyltransferase [Phycisphaera sp.]